MYLFSRTTRLVGGHQRDAMEWAFGITEKVNQVTSLEIALWTTMFSPGVGTLAWACFVESLGDLEDANAKLTADDIFIGMADKGASFTDGRLEDEVAQILSANLDLTRKPSHIAVVRSQLSNGMFQRGVAAGLEIAERATQLGGIPTVFLLATTGTYGGCAWITGASSLKELEAAEQAVNMNPDFIAYVDQEAECYLPGATTQAVWSRLA